MLKKATARSPRAGTATTSRSCTTSTTARRSPRSTTSERRDRNCTGRCASSTRARRTSRSSGCSSAPAREQARAGLAARRGLDGGELVRARGDLAANQPVEALDQEQQRPRIVEVLEAVL